jgi:hypothetical protein
VTVKLKKCPQNFGHKLNLRDINVCPDSNIEVKCTEEMQRKEEASLAGKFNHLIEEPIQRIHAQLGQKYHFQYSRSI